MLSRAALVGSLVLTIAMTSFTATAGRNQTQPSSEGPNRQELGAAVNLIRAINTAEMQYKAKHDELFAAWDDLVVSYEFQEVLALPQCPAEVKNANFKDPSNIMPGWQLRLFVSASGEHYVATLVRGSMGQNVPISVSGCWPALFSDDQGLIRQAVGIGCATDAVSSEH